MAMNSTKTGKALHKRQEILLSDPSNTILYIGDEQFYFKEKEINVLRKLNINTIEQFMLLDLYHIDNAHGINSTTLKLLYRSQGILNRLIGNIVIDNDIKIKKIKKNSKTGNGLYKRQEILLSDPSNIILEIGDMLFYFEEKEINVLRKLNINTIEQFMLLDLEYIEKTYEIKFSTLKLLYRSQGILEELINNIEIDNDVKINKIKKNTNIPVIIAPLKELYPDLINQLNLSTNDNRALHLMKIDTVRQFLQLDLQRLYDLQGYGIRTFMKLTAVQKKIKKGLKRKTSNSLSLLNTKKFINDKTKIDFSSCENMLLSWLQTVIKKENQMNVIKMRMGFGQQYIPTLQECAEKLNLSREGIRQILYKLRIESNSQLLKRFWDFIENILNNAGGVLLISEISILLKEEFKWERCPSITVIKGTLSINPNINITARDIATLKNNNCLKCKNIPKILEHIFLQEKEMLISEAMLIIEKCCSVLCKYDMPTRPTFSDTFLKIFYEHNPQFKSSFKMMNDKIYIKGKQLSTPAKE